LVRIQPFTKKRKLGMCPGSRILAKAWKKKKGKHQRIFVYLVK